MTAVYLQVYFPQLWLKHLLMYFSSMHSNTSATSVSFLGFLSVQWELFVCQKTLDILQKQQPFLFTPWNHSKDLAQRHTGAALSALCLSNVIFKLILISKYKLWEFLILYLSFTAIQLPALSRCSCTTLIVANMLAIYIYNCLIYILTTLTTGAVAVNVDTCMKNNLSPQITTLMYLYV